MNLTTLLYSIENGIGTIVLNRPDVYNACNETLTTELQNVLRSASDDSSVRCVVIRGAGKAFCSGQDLKDAPGAEGNGSFSDALQRRYNPVIRLMRDMPKPIIAGINGVAAGAGLSLALAADIRVMSSAARLVEAFAGIALVPDSGASYFYVKILGYSKAFEFATLNKAMTADDALRLGMVNMVAAPDVFDTALKTVAEQYASGPTKTFGYVKKLLQQGMTSSLEDVLLAEENYQQLAGESEDYQEGVRAFIEKRAPQFSGR